MTNSQVSPSPPSESLSTHTHAFLSTLHTHTHAFLSTLGSTGLVQTLISPHRNIGRSPRTGFPASVTCHTAKQQPHRDSNHIYLSLWSLGDLVRVRGGEGGRGKWSEAIYWNKAKKKRKNQWADISIHVNHRSIFCQLGSIAHRFFYIILLYQQVYLATLWNRVSSVSLSCLFLRERIWKT